MKPIASSIIICTLLLLAATHSEAAPITEELPHQHSLCVQPSRPHTDHTLHSALHALRTKLRFHDLYECYIITDVEVSSTEEEEEDYEYVDRDDFMTIICRAKKSYIAFEPAYVCNLYDDEGIRYVLYVSRNCTYFRIDSNYFRLSRRQARALKLMLP